ncbi:ABC transporter substrate-binding protein [Marmoricola endophyticus]|uniref:ABC transporter substrate-binding protein n=1 Tax=Marmoricola endophyticus TaxID=2040280 RepID=A0A917BGC2_9ACTN|nr:MCE family protein [Marmoricola endophyticus]GGF43339.1 ABC transporter substrate-binding protein [Marmoricola endophyticus]
MATPFRERDPVKIGFVSILVLALLMLAAFNASKLPLIGGGDVYYANFSEAGGLTTDNEVRIAGVRVGKVDSIDLRGGHVRVGFRIEDGSKFGPDSSASIKIKTLLGQEFLAVQPQGKGQMKEGSTIPMSRTTSPFDVVDAFSGLSDTVQDIDTDQLAQSLDTLASVTKNTPESLRGTLKGLSALSDTVASRDAEINTLLKNTRRVAKVLDARDGDIVTLLDDANTLLRALVARREAIHNILVSATRLSKELTTLVRQTRADLKPTLKSLDGTVQILNRNQTNIDQALRSLAPFIRVFGNTLGNGPFFDVIIQNLPIDTSQLSTLTGGTTP